ncbi:MAG: hypothetical protein RSJ41_08175 [Clostridia bacterium]
MKREDIARIISGATDEQISALLDLNSRDIGKTKAAGDKLQGDMDALSEQLARAGETIKALEGAQGDTEKLRAQLDAYRQTEEARAKKASEDARRASIEDRFDAVVGERKFLHPLVRNGVLDAFDAAVSDAANRGKGDKALFDALTKEQGFFASLNPPAPNMPPLGDPCGGDDGKAKFLKLSLYEQFLYAGSHPDEAKKYLEE